MVAMIAIVPIAISVFIWMATPAVAQVETLATSHTYIMGDNDSRNDARHICFLEAKRKLLEMAGVYIQSHDQVVNSELTKSQITSYSAAVLGVEVIKEDFGFSNGQGTVTLKVKAIVDLADVRNRLKAIAGDKDLQEKIVQQQNQLRTMEEQVRQLNSKLSDISRDASLPLRKERNVVIGNIEELENKKLAAVQRIAEEERKIAEASEKIRNFIVMKMTKKEVDDILGPPLRSVYRWKGPFFYGELWVCVEDRLGSGEYTVSGAGMSSECKPNLLAR